MKKTRWMVVVWTILVFGTILWGDTFWKNVTKISDRRAETQVGDAADYVNADSSEEASMSDAPGAEENSRSKYNCENTYHLPSSEKTMDGFERYEQEFTYMSGHVQYNLLIDFPDSTMAHGENIRSWLIKEIERALLSYEELYSEEDNVKHRSIYKGDSHDKEAMGYCLGKYFFDINHAQYGDTAEHYPYSLFQNFTMEAVDVTNRYVTYRRLLRNYYGGTHELYTNRLLSYDPVHQEVIDWDYLFRSQYKKSILMLVSEEAMKDERFLYWEGYRFVDDDEERINFFSEKGSVELKGNIHHVGLYRNGVVFSYQPYALSCFAAGDFHFVVSCEKLKPYMTKRGKAWVGLRD